MLFFKRLLALSLRALINEFYPLERKLDHDIPAPPEFTVVKEKD